MLSGPLVSRLMTDKWRVCGRYHALLDLVPLLCLLGSLVLMQIYEDRTSESLSFANNTGDADQASSVRYVRYVRHRCYRCYSRYTRVAYAYSYPYVPYIDQASCSSDNTSGAIRAACHGFIVFLSTMRFAFKV